jgi:drug/metabolite transporter (DMT)-like permease
MSAAAVESSGLGFIALGLAAASFWGASDFLGGLATRKGQVMAVVAVAHGLSLVLLVVAAFVLRSPLPPHRFMLLGLCAGTVGGVALILYYQALSLGEMGITTALSGLLTALVPIVHSFLTQGSPKLTQLAGFVVAGAAIALIAYAPAGSPRLLALGLGSIAGLCFGIFLVILKEGATYSLLWQLVFSRVASSTLAGGLLLGVLLRPSDNAGVWRKKPGGTGFLWVAGAAGVLEATGSLLYMQATREGRLDVAAVLASLYPTVTIVLAAWFLKERATSSQTVGMALALGAVVLVSI